MNTYRAAVIGAGAIAHTHLRTLGEDARTEVVAIADINSARAESIAASHKIKAYTNYQQMIQEEKPDIVINTLPHFLHKDATIWCAAQGCHVLVEKPMAMNVEECTEMIQAAVAHQVLLAVGHVQPYMPPIRKAKEVIQSGRLGQLIMINERRYTHYFNDRRPDWFLDQARSGGGIVMNLGSHSVDKIHWITDDVITEVKASLTYHAEKGNVEGSGHLHFRTSQGISASVTLCGYRQVPINETELLFTGGQMKITGMNSLWISDDSQKEFIQLDTDHYPDPFSAQWNDLLNAIEHGQPLQMTGEYGRTVASVIAAVYQSHKTGQEQTVHHL